MQTPSLPSLRTLCAIAILGLGLGSSELKLKEADHKTLSKLIGEYFKAVDDEKGIQEALSKVLDKIDDTQKKLKNEKLLAAVSDWEQVFWYVQQERLKESLKSKGKVDEFRTKSPTGDVAFAYSLPKTYQGKKGPYLLILTVPDEGEKPTAHLDAQWSDAALREGAVLVAVQTPADSQMWGTFGTQEAPGGVYAVMSTLAVVQRELAIDFNRIFLAGSAKGFSAAAATAAAYPQLFAGLVGIGDVPAVDATNFRSLPTLFVNGGEGAKAIQSKVTDLGFGNSSEGGVADVWAWMGKTRREPYPLKISFSPTSDNARRAHWISLEGTRVSENPHVEATVDRASNTVSIETQKISDIVVYLNDALVDMEKPVKVVFNGTPHEQTVPRNAVEMIRSQYFGGDWGRVFMGSVKVP